MTFALIFLVLALVLFTGWEGKEEMTLARARDNVLATVLIAALWALALWAARGLESATQFASGYAMEWMLSIDNLVAISLVFGYFQLPKSYTPRILNIGIWSAAAFRLLFTLVGTSMLSWGRGMEVVFGVIVLATAVKMIMTDGEDHAEMDDHNNRWYIKRLRQWLPVTGDTSEPVFFKKVETATPYEFSRTYATPLLACLISVEITDLTFSLDSVPTVIAVSRTPLVVYSAMIFAIMGLRSMYMLMASAQEYLTRLPQAVAAVLLFVGCKMALSGLLGVTIPSGVALLIVVTILVWGVLASLKERANATRKEEA